MMQGREYTPYESADQVIVRSAVRRYLDDRSGEAEVRRLIEDHLGWDPDVWRGLAVDLGVTALVVPEEDGGVGAPLADLAVVMEEMGRRLLCAPFLSSAVLGAALLRGVDDADLRARWLSRVAEGTVLATVAVAPESRAELSSQTQPVARSRRVDGGWRLTGEMPSVLDGVTADVVLLLASTPDGVGLFAVEDVNDRTAGIERIPMRTLDRTRRQAMVRLSDAPATRVESADPVATVRQALDVAALALAAEQAGVASAALDMASAYVKVRRQFGRPIGEFQVIKHLCAEMMLRRENIRSCARYAARRADADGVTPDVASLTAAYGSRALVEVTSMNIQAHGGIGFTWEHPAHLYFRRAKASQLLFGSAAAHRNRIATAIAA